ncbi:hypothetical protein [Pseudalkalibacillus caeni]|uniref:Uncharacterized protein n=1 Tax=Exobacillus caeni TaxID=2574798 RepID=A0A5R9FA06_9BACL|nr:hypothetical protein [Pseudalkalibacillus caeni]TLS39359.1 hypothetical protein FCL54_03385 [Pseudalkalibacillus caeni]
MNIGDLFDFLMSNIFILIFVIGGIISFLKRMGEEQQQKPVRRTPEASRPDKEMRIPSSSEIEIEEDEYEPAQKHYDVPYPEYDAAETEKPYHRETLSPYERETGKPYKRQSKKPYKRKVSHSLYKSPTRKQVREGVIWAEIIGRPRSQNPHRTVIYRDPKG